MTTAKDANDYACKVNAASGCQNEEGCSCLNPDAVPENPRPQLIRMGCAFVLTLFFSLAFPNLPAPAAWGIYGILYLLAGYKVLLLAAGNIRKGQVFDENFLMSIASLAAFCIGEMQEAIAVMIFYGVGELLEDAAVRRSRRNIGELMDIRPDYANLVEGGKTRKVSPKAVPVGGTLEVRPGEKIPLDGVVLSGDSFVDTRALTGESVPRRTGEGDAVYSGTINLEGVLTVKVTRNYAASTVSKILELVETASSRKARTEQFITRFARVYTPLVVFIALGVALIPPLFGWGTFDSWIYKGISFLIISCPCALVISIPVGFFGGIGGAARNGILVKGGNYLEAMGDLNTMVFDKTGTLTLGVFHVTSIVPAEGVDPGDLLRIAASLEARSNHPIAKSILQAYGREPKAPTAIREKAGLGITGRIEEGEGALGNARLMAELGIQVPGELPVGTVVHAALGSRYLGYLLISDQVRETAKEAIHQLRKSGIRDVVMLTGDKREIAETIAADLGITQVRADLLPEDKVNALEDLLRLGEGKGKLAFVGDGINDAPVLSRADIGIAMGGMGSDAAIEAADIVIMNDDLMSLYKARRIAAKTRRIVAENIVLALTIKVLIVTLALLGITSIWFAVFADVGVAMLAVLNAVRALTVRFLQGSGRQP